MDKDMSMPFAPITFAAVKVKTDIKNAKIYITNFPGLEISAQSESYIHPIEMDDTLEKLAADKVNTLVILTHTSELPTGAMERLLECTKQLHIELVHLPIEDFSIPDKQGEQAWQRLSQGLIASPEVDIAIGFACLSGKGRSGTFAARLLFELGFTPKDAIQMVRSQVPDAIETEEQEAWVSKEILGE